MNKKEADRITKLLLEALELKEQLVVLNKARDYTLGEQPTFGTVERAISKAQKRKQDVIGQLLKYHIELK